ncbi:hypothetical protein EJ06DRAFT_309071 [Trichodelitschia bisporula]|uniref:Uncharacterized protein n=1 Tax=Trichodelitschia bisporula TaxID=703511 RepID=A0A6G1I481_9PEZI|nr:hypothetical protein EJ06DRAFT_309071 [Trichodelitschia bisporula]
MSQIKLCPRYTPPPQTGATMPFRMLSAYRGNGFKYVWGRLVAQTAYIVICPCRPGSGTQRLVGPDWRAPSFPRAMSCVTSARGAVPQRRSGTTCSRMTSAFRKSQLVSNGSSRLGMLHVIPGV